MCDLFVFRKCCVRDATKMETQIIIVLIALRTVSTQLNIPPAPTLPNLDLTSFPEYMQRLLSNRPSLIYVNKAGNEASNQNGNILHDHQIPGANVGVLRTNSVNNQGYSLDRNTVNPDTYEPHKKPHTYGMTLKGDKGEVWNDLNGKHFYINDFAPPKSIHPNLQYNKVEPMNDNEITIPKQTIDLKQNLPPATTVMPEILKPTRQVVPDKIHAILDVPKQKNSFDVYQALTSTLKPDVLHYTSPQSISKEFTAIVHVQTDKNDNHTDDFHENFLTRKPDVLQDTTPQPLSEETPVINNNQQDNNAINSSENENSSEAPKESTDNSNANDKIKESFDNINGTVGNTQNNTSQSPNTYGMKLLGDHGYVWNDLTKPGIHYNVGELETSNTANTTPDEVNSSIKPNEIPDSPNGADYTTANINEEPGTEKTPTTELNDANAETSTNTEPELDDLLKKLIVKFVKEEIARQLGNKGAGDNNGATNSDHNEDKKNDSKPTENAVKINSESSNAPNNYGSITGNGKITNIFVFYPNDKSLQSNVNDNTILNKPVKEILNDILHKDINSVKDPKVSNSGNNMPDDQNSKSSDEAINTMTNLDKNSVDKGIEKSKDNADTPDKNTAAANGNPPTQTSVVQEDANQGNINEGPSTEGTKTVPESSSILPSMNSSLNEINNNNVTIQANSINNEEAALITDAISPNNNDTITSVTDTLNEIVEQNTDETQSTITIGNDDKLELTTNPTNGEDVSAVTPNDMVTNAVADPSGALTEVTVTESNATEGLDEISALSDTGM